MLMLKLGKKINVLLSLSFCGVGKKKLSAVLINTGHGLFVFSSEIFSVASVKSQYVPELEIFNNLWGSRNRVIVQSPYF
jgi:hypothetical protein